MCGINKQKIHYFFKYVCVRECVYVSVNARTIDACQVLTIC